MIDTIIAIWNFITQNSTSEGILVIVLAVAYMIIDLIIKNIRYTPPTQKDQGKKKGIKAPYRNNRLDRGKRKGNEYKDLETHQLLFDLRKLIRDIDTATYESFPNPRKAQLIAALIRPRFEGALVEIELALKLKRNELHTYNSQQFIEMNMDIAERIQQYIVKSYTELEIPREVLKIFGEEQKKHVNEVFVVMNKIAGDSYFNSMYDKQMEFFRELQRVYWEMYYEMYTVFSNLNGEISEAIWRGEKIGE
jgi:hypothetical protein